MRKALLFLIFITSCAISPSQPVPPKALKCPQLYSTKAYIRYRLKIPHKKFSGRLLLLGDTKGRFYVESLGPFGMPVFQANLVNNQVLSIFFPQKEIFVFILQDIPKILSNSWTYLLLGEIPPSWFSGFKYAKKRGEKITALFELDDKGLKAYAVFASNNYNLIKLTLKKSNHTILKISYTRKEDSLKISRVKIPPFRLTLEITFISIKRINLASNFFTLCEPKNFQKKIFMLRLY